MKRDRLATVLAIANQKGGVGKTTTAINLAASLAAMEQRVLIIDLDPQGNATTGLGLEKKETTKSMYDVLIGRRTLDEVIVPTACENLFIAPGSMDLAGAEVELVGVDSRECVLKHALSRYQGKRFRFVFIDCPPSLNLLTINALVAADRVLIPLQAEFYALEGLTQLLQTVKRIRSCLNDRLILDGILLTMLDRRNNLCQQVEEEVRRYFGRQVYQQVIPRNVRLSEAPSYGMPVMYHDLRSRGAQAYLSAASELLHRERIRGEG